MLMREQAQNGYTNLLGLPLQSEVLTTAFLSSPSHAISQAIKQTIVYLSIGTICFFTSSSFMEVLSTYLSLVYHVFPQCPSYCPGRFNCHSGHTRSRSQGCQCDSPKASSQRRRAAMPRTQPGRLWHVESRNPRPPTTLMLAVMPAIFFSAW